MAEEAPPPFAASEGPNASLPPGYADHSTSTPIAVARPRMTERVYTLETSKKRPWAFLKVNSRGGKATSIPSFLQGELITGTVELDLDKTEYLEAVTIEARGETLTVGQEPLLFLTQKTTLWSISMGDPGSGKPGSGSPKLKGKYVWPFSIGLPEKVSASAIAKGVTSEYALPPSFSERASPSYLEYKIVVTFCRGRFRVDNTLATSFAYLQRTRPPAFSALRQLAYSENSTPPGMEVDPEGWEDLGTKFLIGTVFDSRKVEVACLFALAKPLCYTRGTSIPFALTLSCSDKQTLDLFTARGSLTIHLVRTLRIGVDATDKSKVARSDNTFIANVGQGIYWPAHDDNLGSETRKLEGEIPVKVDLKPTFVFPRMAIKYHISFSLGAPGFTVTSDDGPAHFSREVEIVTAFSPGLVPQSRIPAALAKESTGNYDVSIGMLTGANQRFIHHHAFG